MKASKKRGALALALLSPALLLLSGCSNSSSNCDPNHPTPGNPDGCNGTTGHSGSGYFGSGSHSYGSGGHSFGSGSQSDGASARGGFGGMGHIFGGGGHGFGGGG